MTLPDVTADIQLAADEGKTFNLEQDSTVSAEIEITQPGFKYKGNRNWLTPVPGSFKDGQRIFQGRGVNGYKFERLWIRGSIDPIDVAVFMPDKSDTGVVLKDTVLQNLGHADPVHFGCDGIVIDGYTYTENTPGVDYDGLVVGPGTIAPKGVKIRNVQLGGTLEIDCILVGGYIRNLSAMDCLIGVSVPAGSWGGHTWIDNHFGPRPGNVVLQFSPSQGRKVGQDWTIRDTVVDGAIGNPELFFGTWGKGNTPATL